ncbi:hypothetical protein C5167_017796 [Papaver somniferum]|uniref:Uncharacterized protein n=1 Tax=Papaver somniferum TaxID=3469 RepID=A0A4Y7IPH3_PAPSO|nr:hypothetical protein C5167_017796 [Papaver somniferum]
MRPLGRLDSGAKIQITRDAEADRYATTRPIELDSDKSPNEKIRPHMNAFEDPYVFTATSSDAPLISETVGDDDYWSGTAQGDDEYSDVDDQVIMLVSIKCLSL